MRDRAMELRLLRWRDLPSVTTDRAAYRRVLARHTQPTRWSPEVFGDEARKRVQSILAELGYRPTAELDGETVFEKA